jgi:uncharacterized membrane protein
LKAAIITINWPCGPAVPILSAMARKKTLTFALTHMTVAFAVGWALTGSAAIGGALALVEPLVNTVAYFFHEKLWEKRAAAA